MNEDQKKMFEEMRFNLLKCQVELERASEEFRKEVVNISAKITVLRTEILSLLNSDIPRETGD